MRTKITREGLDRFKEALNMDRLTSDELLYLIGLLEIGKSHGVLFTEKGNALEKKLIAMVDE